MENAGEHFYSPFECGLQKPWRSEKDVVCRIGARRHCGNHHNQQPRAAQFHRGEVSTSRSETSEKLEVLENQITPYAEAIIVVYISKAVREKTKS